MKREEAVQIVHNTTYGNFSEGFVNALEKLGLLKFEKEKTPYEIIHEITEKYDPEKRWIGETLAGKILNTLPIYGYEIRKKNE